MDATACENTARKLFETFLSNAKVPDRKDIDYFNEDGLLVCGKCGKRKQSRIEFPYIGYRVVPVMCGCQEEEYEQRKADEAREKEQRIVDEMFRFSLIDDRFKENTFSACQETEHNAKAIKIAKRYVEHFEELYAKNKGLLFYGEPGTGKTFIADCIANALLEKRVPLIVTSIIKLTSASGPFTKEAEEQRKLIDRMNAARLLFIDDLGTERDTEYKLEQVFEIIDSRYGSKRPMIITTNLSLQQMQSEPDVRKRRIYERIFEVCYPVKLTGKSWRLQTARNDFDELKGILLG